MLSEYAYVKRFADRFGCELTEQKGGEHWFHTEEVLEFFRQWIQERIRERFLMRFLCSWRKNCLNMEKMKTSSKICRLAKDFCR